MKKTLFFILGLTLNSMVFSQQLPNGNFENWTLNSPCMNLDSLHSFTSSDALLYHFNGINYCTPVPAFKRTTDAQNGTYAVKMQPTSDGGVVSYVNFQLGGKIGSIVSAIPYTFKPEKLTGYYKYVNGGNDSLRISLTLLNNSSAPINIGVAKQSFFTSTSGSTYQYFEIPISYDPNYTSLNAEYLGLDISIFDKTNQQSANANSILTIDNLNLDFGASAGVEVIASSDFVVKNKNIYFVNSVSNFTVYNYLGQEEYSDLNSNSIFDLSNLKSGVYIVSYSVDNISFTKRIMIN